MSDLVPRRQQLPAEAFRWRDRFGTFHPIDKMETRHLFHTLSMIWNHTMPDDAKTHDHRRYHFSLFYTVDYMRRAIFAIVPELETRPNLAGSWRLRIQFMKDYLAGKRRLPPSAAQEAITA